MYRLTGRRFRIINIWTDGKPVPVVPKSDPILRFDDANFRATTGCNPLQGQYALDQEGYLQTRGVVRTLIGCSPELTRQEHLIVQVLSEGACVAFDGDRIFVENNAVKIEAVDLGVDD